MIDIHPTLPLESFRSIIGFNPFWFWGMADNSEVLRPGAQPGLQGCRGVTKEFSWQDRDYAGRQDIRESIARAENMMADQLRYYPAPVYLEETVEWPRLADKRYIRGGPYDADDRWLSVKLKYGYIQSSGIEARSSIALASAVTYTDADGDGYLDTASIGPVATTITNVKEIAVYFTSTDRYGYDSALSEQWRIAPLNITISGGQVTIKGPAWMFIRPILLSGLNADDIDPNAAPSPLASTVDIYRHYTDGSSTSVDSSQGVIIWETRPTHGWWCVCSACNSSNPFAGSPYDPAATAQAVARVGIRSAKDGVVIPAESTFNSTDGTWSSINWWVCEEPDRVTVRYLAGYPLDPDGQMSVKYRELVAVLAAAELSRPTSGCADANRLLFYWQQDLSKTGNDRELYATSADILDNPFGTRRGHVYAWKKIVHLARGTGLRVG